MYMGVYGSGLFDFGLYVPCVHTFWFLTFLHLFSFFIENVFYYFFIISDFSSPLAIEMYGRPFFSVPSLHREYYRTL